MAQLFFNNAYGFLNAAITDLDTSIVLRDTTGLPATLGVSDWFLMTVYNSAGQYGSDHEVVKVMAVTDNADGTWTLTVERGIELPAVAHGLDEPVEARLTAGTMTRIDTTEIDDTVTATDTAWSSQKISDEMATKHSLLEAPTSISVNTTATAYTYYVLTASVTLTLPATPVAGNWLRISNRSGTKTGIVARNGSNIMGLAENMTLDTENAGFTLTYVGATQGWVIT